MSKKEKRKKIKKHPKLGLALKIIVLFILLVTLAGMAIFYVKYGNTLLKWQAEAKELVDDSSVDTFKASETSLVYASNKKLLAKLKGEKDSYYLPSSDIPQQVKDAFVVTEDRDFYSHSGYDLKAIASAGVQLVISKIKGDGISRGGSTITQQLARKIWLSDSKTYTRKIKEIFIATELEKKYTKDQILEFYINNIYFANGYYGIEAASKGYFSKSATKLSLSEIAFLCSIPNRPSSYDPFQHFNNTINRKGRILDQLLQEKLISKADYSDAYYSDVVLNPAETLKTQNYMTTYAVSCATRALMENQGFKFRYNFKNDADKNAYEKEFNEAYDENYKSLYSSGYRIYTSLNKKKQDQLQKAVNAQLTGFKDKTNKGVYKLQGAATCIDNATGRVVAIVGGRKQKNTVGYTLNRAFQSDRQPGSCFKPLVVYTPQLERGYSADSIVDDTYFKGGPRNSSGTYAGKITLRSAVENSKNVVAWRLFTELTPKVGLSYVKKMHFANIVQSDNYPAASLGGLTHGVTTTEMASGYSTIANDGKYRVPTCVVKIVDADGNVVVNTTKAKAKQVYEKRAARLMTNILEGVLVRGTARGNALDNMSCAGKTGTTSDKKDGWFCGYTPYYTTTVWVGYDNPKTLYDLYGNTYPLRIWRQFMSQIHTGLENKTFAPYYNLDASGSTYSSNDNNNSTATAAPKETVDPGTLETQPTQAPTNAPSTKAPANSDTNQDSQENTGGNTDENGNSVSNENVN